METTPGDNSAEEENADLEVRDFKTGAADEGGIDTPHLL